MSHEIPDAGAVHAAEAPEQGSPGSERFRRVAPLAHTVRFVAVFLGVTGLAAVRTAHVEATPEQSHLVPYVVMLAMVWALFAFALLGLKRGGTPLGEIIGGRFRSITDVLTTVVLAAGFWLAARYVLEGEHRALELLGQSTNAEAQRTLALLAPHGAIEIGLWFLLSVSAGFCEELIFRGYLQRQFTALTRRPAAGIVISALVFGAGHLYQGWRSVVVISTYGLLFGLLAYFSKSLRPGMIAHAWQDISSGLLHL